MCTRRNSPALSTVSPAAGPVTAGLTTRATTRTTVPARRLPVRREIRVS
ncbi:hypothetical protein [Protofrankia symbiont of Coriaria ruscifolia]|nr:hypothetical protein [Protofrankia symbiont of Coriaria ruscifolia]